MVRVAGCAMTDLSSWMVDNDPPGTPDYAMEIRDLLQIMDRDIHNWRACKIEEGLLSISAKTDQYDGFMYIDGLPLQVMRVMLTYEQRKGFADMFYAYYKKVRADADLLSMSWCCFSDATHYGEETDG